MTTKREKAEEKPEEQSEEEPQQGGEVQGGGAEQPVHEEGYTEETAKQHAEDFGTQASEQTLEGKGNPGVA